MKKPTLFVKNSLCVVVFLLILALVLGQITTLVKPKWHENDYWEASTDIQDGLYNLPKNSIDVLFLGSSHAFRGFNPLELYQNYGITSYVYAGSLQRNWTTLTFLQEALKTQSPQVVVLDCYMVADDELNDENRNRKQFDYMKESSNKETGLLDAMNPEEDILSYRFPLLQYHARWSDLSKEDFAYDADQSYYLHGYDITFEKQSNQNWSYETPADLTYWNEFLNANSRSKQYLDQISDLCNRRGIKLFLTAAPNNNWHTDQSKIMQNYAEAWGFSYIDYCAPEQIARIGFDMENDFQDPMHLNVWGTQKFMRALGEDLRNLYGLADHRGEEETDALWNADWARYQSRLAQNQLAGIGSVTDYITALQQLDKNDYALYIVGNDNWNRDQDDATVLSPLYLATGGMDTWNTPEIVYAIDLNGSAYGTDGVLRRNVNGTSISLSLGDAPSITVQGEEKAVGKNGLNIVVYSVREDAVVDAVCIRGSDLLR